MKNMTTIINLEYNKFVQSLRDYERTYLDYCKEKEKKKLHWVH